MSPYREKFINFQTIAPRSIGAADNRVFQAVGRGDMYINVPTSNSFNRVLLKDVLYAPTMAVTLVSVSRITASGAQVLFDKTTCKI
ncbi:hypothetical protein GGU11DRAFT_651915, partial [Lentinula aff. detonsa]